jgi:hypothetical protein
MIADVVSGRFTFEYLAGTNRDSLGKTYDTSSGTARAAKEQALTELGRRISDGTLTKPD